MAKATSVNINSINPSTLAADVGYGIYGLMTLLLANGWTLVSCGTGTAGVRRATPALSQAEWIAATNTWQIVSRGNVWLTVRRVSTSVIDVRYAVAAPATAGNATTPDSQVTAANEVAFLSLSCSGSTRSHAITFDSDDNAAGIRSFYLFWTSGYAVVGGFVLEAMADGTYAVGNPAPYAVAASSGSGLFSSSSNAWAFWYSPSSLWVSLNFPLNMETAAGVIPFGSSTPAGVDPWSSKDVAIPVAIGRTPVSTGFVGVAKSLKYNSVNRGYPNVVNNASDAYVFANLMLVPFENNILPI